ENRAILFDDKLFLWEVILNGDSPPPTRIVDDVVQIVAPTTAEQMLARKNELKSRRTLLMALPDKHQLKFNIHKDAKSVMKAIEKRFGADLEEPSLDDLFKNLKIYEAEVKGSSTSSPNIQNIAFVSSKNTNSTNDLVNAASSVSAACPKAKFSTLPKGIQITKGQQSFQAEEEPTNYALMAYTSPGSSSSLVSELHSQESDNRVTKNQENDRYKTGEEYHVVPPSYTLNFFSLKPDLVFTDDTNASESVSNVINIESTKHKTSKDKSKTHRPDAPIIKDWISDSEDEIEIKVTRVMLKKPQYAGFGNQNGNSQQALQDKDVIDSGCSRHITGNISFPSEFEEIDGGYVAFGRDPKGGKISGGNNSSGTKKYQGPNSSDGGNTGDGVKIVGGVIGSGGGIGDYLA
nr:ribonuclease H-like domain-containing protein [Tanacetum cinerariifolium]